MHIFENVVSPFCLCTCDDLTISQTLPNKFEVQGGCELSRTAFLKVLNEANAASEFEPQLEQLLPILKEAQAPAIIAGRGWATASYRAMLQLAELMQALFLPDNVEGRSHELAALQDVGEVTCSLGEIATRADLILFLNMPAAAQEEALDRFRKVNQLHWSTSAPKTLSLDLRELMKTTSAEISSNDSLLILRNEIAVLRGEKRIVQREFSEVIRQPLQELATALLQAKYSVIVEGNVRHASSQDVRQEGQEVACSTTLANIISDLNRSTRAHRFSWGPPSANAISGWTTGTSGAVRFLRGLPEPIPVFSSLAQQFKHANVDLCLIFGSHGFCDLDESLQRQLKEIPCIVIEPTGAPIALPLEIGDVIATIEVAVDGVHQEGTLFRKDGIGLPLRKVAETTAPSVPSLVARLIQNLQ